MKNLKKIYYFASTHWDREWYKTVDEFRFRLVPVMQKITRTLENDENFKIFTTDGQTCILEDYLAVKKEDEAKLRALIQSGRLKIGPWYTMPDEFLLSHESLVQNLLKGHYLAAEYGAPKALKNGYVCDIFGHVANLPQILNGFGIRSAFISRGTNDCDTPCFFRWRSPDGSEALTFKAPETCGYGSFFYDVLSEYSPDYAAHEEEIFAAAVRYVERECTRTDLPYVILADGMDHETIHEFMPALLTRLSAHFSCPAVQLPLDEVFAEIEAKKEETPVITGELAALCKENVMHNKLIPHTLSSRYDLKRANDDCQAILEKYAMPIAAMRAARGEEIDYGFIDYAYTLLLQNHAHDSICGCSIDAVHGEMLTRFEKCRRTALAYSDTYFAEEYAKNYKKDGKTYLEIYNPLPVEREETLTATIRFDADFPVRELPYIKYEQRNSFRIFDENGREIHYTLLSAARGVKALDRPAGNAQTSDVHVVSFAAKLLPCAYTVFEIRPYERPCRYTERLSDSPVSCRNEKIAFSVNPDGTVKITDNETGITYDRLHSFTDCGEIGDGWFHIRPVADELYSSEGCEVSVCKKDDGVAACSFLVVYRFRIPEYAEKVNEFCRRSGETILKIESTFTVEKHSKIVKVHTVVRNHARDHKLCLRLPVDCTDSYFADQCGTILKRETGIDPESWNWKESDIPERQFTSMVFTRNESGKKGGLLFVSKGGLHETANCGGANPALNITLFRSFSKTVGTNGEKDGLLQGDLVFDYAIAPVAEETDAELIRIKENFVHDVKSFTVRGENLKNSEPFMEFLSANCVYDTATSEKDERGTIVPNGIIVRASNYSEERSAGEIRFCREPKEAYLCDYLGNKTGEAQLRGNSVLFVAAPYAYVNVKIRF